MSFIVWKAGDPRLFFDWMQRHRNEEECGITRQMASYNYIQSCLCVSELSEIFSLLKSEILGHFFPQLKTNSGYNCLNILFFQTYFQEEKEKNSYSDKIR